MVISWAWNWNRKLDKAFPLVSKVGASWSMFPDQDGLLGMLPTTRVDMSMDTISLALLVDLPQLGSASNNPLHNFASTGCLVRHRKSVHHLEVLGYALERDRKSCLMGP